ncbi:DUF4132 domain-containing protein [Actinomadura napierensis]|uniref:DUF4132 domain-containing protein n=1 Tax=Actinomadura napierensis TaxID=267854 RepID=A0ABP5LQ50_9ACTN
MDDLPPPPDEDALTLPAAWRRKLHPRRGGLPGPAFPIDDAAPGEARALIEMPGGPVGALAPDKSGAPDLAEAALRHLAGEPDPAGAAAVATVAVLNFTLRRADAPYATFIDSWIIEHGLPFAACAAVGLARTTGQRSGTDGPWKGGWAGVNRGLNDVGRGPLADGLRKVRALLAATDEQVYAEAIDRLAAHRDGPEARWLVSYLVPTRRDWVEECSAAPVVKGRGGGLLTLALASLGEAEQLAAPYPALGLQWGAASIDILATMADGIGPGLLPFLLDHLDRPALNGDGRKRVAKTIALLPSDEAFRVLLERRDHKYLKAELGEALKRFPVRAVRLLAEAGEDALLQEHVRTSPGVVAALPRLPDDVRAAVEKAAGTSARVPEAPGSAVPEILAAPPWENPRQPVVAGLTSPEGAMRWRDGEHADWLGTDVGSVGAPPSGDPEALAQAIREGGVGSMAPVVHAPEDVVRPLLAGWKGVDRYDTPQWMRRVIARYGLDALPPTLRIVKKNRMRIALLTPFLHADVALFMGDRLSGNDAHAGRWYDRHGLDAVPHLVPAALGKAKAARRSAVRALRHLGRRGDPGTRRAIADAARAAHGDEAAAVFGGLLAAHPVETGETAPPKLPGWAAPAVLPQVLLREGGRALPEGATTRLVELLALPSPYGLEAVREACDPASLAEFGWALFQKWQDAGAPSKEGWALIQLGRTGDDTTVRRLTPVIRAWPGDGRHAYAVTGLEVLTGIGSDVALMHLHGIAQKVKFKGIKNEAQRRMRQVADRLGLSTDQLADRIVPAFGLDDDGAMTLDYGPRRFTVGFDEALRPVVAGGDGKPRRSLPKPGAKDDPALAPAAYQAFADLKKDVRTAAADLLRRLEGAMVAQRRWTPAEFGEYVVGHPLVRHVARRLVWFAQDGGAVTSFRIAEDRTFADVGDDLVDVHENAAIGLAHPVQLGDALGAWSEVFADYEILQPFPQLGRTVHTLGEAERGSERLERFENLKVPLGTVVGLVNRGWEIGAPQDAGVQRWISRRVPGNRYVVIDLDPGLYVGEPAASGDHQTLEYAWLGAEATDHRYRSTKEAPLRFGDLDPVTASEVLADLTRLAEAAA